MNRKHITFALLLVVVSIALCACSSGGVPLAPTAPTLTLPPASLSFVAPIGDAALEYTSDATLYLPRHDGTRLSALTAQVSFSAARPHAESLVRALLSHPGDGMASPVGGNVKLSLSGANPVEVSRDVATVNLAASALQLDRRFLYTACQAIANTLTELPEINYVNVLVADRPVGLDIANTLPMGTLGRNVAQDPGTVYEQLLSRRVEANENAAEKTLSASVTLYFPLSGSPGLVSEVRACSFNSQVFSDMVTVLLQELASGPQQNIDSPALPLLADLLTAPPALAYSEASGGQIVTLHFAHNLDDMLETYGLTRAQSMASLCYTLCTYFPSIAGVQVTIGGEPVGTLLLTEDFQSTVTFEQSVQRRADFAPLLYDYCTLFFADHAGQKLVRTERPVPYYRCNNPRSLLVELAKGPKSYDSVQNLTGIMPEEAILDADVLGLALSGNTLLVNFAPAFKAIGEGLDGQRDRLLAYAMVNTLCCDERMRSVCFFLSGSQFEGFSGQIYWSGLFYPMGS